MCMQVLMNRSTLLPFRHRPSCVFRQGLSLAWDSSIKLWWPESEPQRPACPHFLQHWSYKGTLRMALSFWCEFLAWNPGLHAWKAGIPQTKPSPALSSCFNVKITLKWESGKGDASIALPVRFSLDICKHTSLPGVWSKVKAKAFGGSIWTHALFLPRYRTQCLFSLLRRRILKLCKGECARKPF